MQRVDTECQMNLVHPPVQGPVDLATHFVYAFMVGKPNLSLRMEQAEMSACHWDAESAGGVALNVEG